MTAERRDVPRGSDPVLDALVELARSAIRNRRAAAEARGKITVMDGGRKDGQAA